MTSMGSIPTKLPALPWALLLALLSLGYACPSSGQPVTRVRAKTVIKATFNDSALQTHGGGDLQRQYKPTGDKEYAQYLENLQQAFDSSVAGRYTPQEFIRLRFLLYTAIQLDRLFVGEGGFLDFMKAALFGLVAHADASSDIGFGITEAGVRIGPDTVVLRWEERSDLEADLHNIENYLTILDRIRRADPNLAVDNLVGASVYAMCRMLNDPYTRSQPVFSEVDRAKSKAEGTTNFERMGLELRTEEDGGYAVLSLQYGYSAYAAGVKQGDRITAVNGIPLQDVSPDSVRRLFADTINELDIERRRPEGLRRVRLLVPNVVHCESDHRDTNVSRLLCDNSIGYLRIRGFEDLPFWEYEGDMGTFTQQVVEAVNMLEAGGAEGIILDLRGNPGGDANLAEVLASIFLERGQCVQEFVEKRSPPRRFFVSGRNHPTRLPLVVLCNARSASSSEVVSAALQDNRRAVIIGDPTFGKGTAWQPFASTDGQFSVMVKSAVWLTPRRTCVNALGVVPDISCQQIGVAGAQASDFLTPFHESGVADDVALRLLETSLKILQPDIREWQCSRPSRLGKEFLRVKQYGMAERAFREALRANPQDADALAGIAEICSEFGLHELAREFLLVALSSRPDDSHVLYLIGRASLQLGDVERAEKDFRQSLSLNPFHPNSNYGLALALRRLERKQEADVYLEKAYVLGADTSSL